MNTHDPLVQDEVPTTLSHLWPTAHRDAIVQLSIIDAYLQLRADGIEELEVRATARSAAHHLADTLELFGLRHGSGIARRIDFALADVPSLPELPSLRTHATSLRASLDAATP